jgi:hypothetical protein
MNEAPIRKSINPAVDIEASVRRTAVRRGIKPSSRAKRRILHRKCSTGVSVTVDGVYHSLQPENTKAFFEEQTVKKLTRKKS